MHAQAIPISRVRLSSYRPVAESSLPALMDSMRTSGLINPITVSSATVMDGGIAVDGYQVIAGNHRVEAAKRLGWHEIDAVISEVDNKLARELMTIDENLMRSELSPSQRADHTARRKAIYETLYPDTKNGGDRRSNNARSDGQLDHLKKPSFADSTAEATGRSRESVNRDARRGSRIDPTVMADLHGTRFDKGTYLDALAKLPAAEQRQKLDHDMRWGENTQPPAARPSAPSPQIPDSERDEAPDAPKQGSDGAQPTDVERKRLSDLKRQFQMLTPACQREFADWAKRVSKYEAA